MARKTDGVRDLVREVLHAIPKPYPSDVTDRVCQAIEANRSWKARYDELASDLRAWVVNNWIGQYTAELTGRKSGKQKKANSALITGYKELPA